MMILIRDLSWFYHIHFVMIRTGQHAATNHFLVSHGDILLHPKLFAVVFGYLLNCRLLYCHCEVMVSPSPLFERIVTCSNAIRHHGKKDIDNNHSSQDEVSAYNEVMKFMPEKTITERPKTRDVTKASLEYMKQTWRGLADAKAQIALYVAILIAYDKAKYGLAKEVCDRFRFLDDFDRHAMEQIFKISGCNDRVCKLLDNILVTKTEGISAIEHEFKIQFIEIFFNQMASLVGDGHDLSGLGYTADVKTDDMERAREIICTHSDYIATKCFTCFKEDVLKPTRKQNNLYPAGDALPYVSIGREPVIYDCTATETLKTSLIDKPEKEEFLEIMFAAISYASNNDPIATLRGIKLDSVKDFFLKKVLDKDQEEETRKAILASDEARGLYHKVEILKQENSSLEEELSSVKETALFREKHWEKIGGKYEDIVFKFNSMEDELNEKRKELSRVKQDLAFEKMEVENLRDELTKKKRKRSPKEKNDLIWHKSHIHQHNYSGDEEE